MELSLLCKHKNMSDYYKIVHYNFTNTDTEKLNGASCKRKHITAHCIAKIYNVLNVCV
jgi:hypothetical protein